MRRSALAAHRHVSRAAADARGPALNAPFRRGPFGQLPERPARAHDYFAEPLKQIAIDSQPFGRIEIAYREAGQGPPLLLVHGLMTSSYSWRYVLAALAARYRVIAPDLPGSGRSSKPTGVRYSGSAYARFLVELVDALKIRGCACVGNSLGGYLVLRAALLDPTLFSKVVDVHSPGVPELRLRVLSLALALPGMRAALAWWIRRDPLRWAHANVHYYDESLKSLEEARAYGEPLSTREGARAFVDILGDVLAPVELEAFVASLLERRTRGDHFVAPLLFLYAREDPMVPPEIGIRLHALLPSAKMIWLEKTSHFAHVDTPGAVLSALDRFL